jgi:hypothetical protein
MENFASYLANLPKTPLVEAVTALYESTSDNAGSAYQSKEEEMFSTLVSYVKWSLTENWIHTASDVRKYGTFMFQCNLGGIMPTLHVTVSRDTPMFADDPDVIEIVSNDPVLLQCYMKEMQGEDTTSMQQDVTDAIMKILNGRKDYITSRLHEMSAEDITGQASMEPTTLLWKLDDILSNYYTSDYKQMPFTKFAKQYLGKPTEDALKELAEMIQFHGGTVTTEDRSHSGGALKFNHYKKLAKLADDKKLTTAQVINYLTGVYSIGNYLGCSGIIQLNNGMIYSDGYVYDRDTVINALKSLYDSTFYEDAVEEWNDHDYRRESLMHELRGNRYPLPRQHRVHRLKNGDAPEYRTWVSTVDQSTGKRPIDTVLDQLKNGGDAKHIKPNKNLDLLISQSGTLPSVESSRKIATALYENTHADRAVRVNKMLNSFIKDLNEGISRKFHEELDRKIRKALLRLSCKFSLSDDERKSMEDDVRKNTQASISNFSIRCAGLYCDIDFATWNPNALAGYRPFSNTIAIYVRSCLDSMEYDYWDDDNGELDSIYDDVDIISTECENSQKVTVTSQTIDRTINILQSMFSSNWFISVIRHELTHHDQRTSGEQQDHYKYMADHEPSIDRSDKSFLHKYHDIFPWEIDSNVQEHTADIVHDVPSADITKLAKRYYDNAMYSVKSLGKDTPERRKQCWQTAVSLARAAKYATDEHGNVPLEWTGHNDAERQQMNNIIGHMGDYPV